MTESRAIAITMNSSGQIVMPIMPMEKALNYQKVMSDNDFEKVKKSDSW